MAYNFLAPENSFAGTLNKQNIDMAKGIFALPTERPVFTSFGGMRKPEAPQPEDETFDELDTTKMTEEERQRLRTGAPAAPEFFPQGSPASRFLETAGAVASAIPRVANLIPRAATNAMLPEGMRLKPAPAAPQQVAPQPQAPVAPAAPAAQAPAAQPAQRPAAPTVQQPVAQGMRAAPRLNVLGQPVQTLDQQGGYKVYGPGGAVATEIPWNPTDESALRRTLSREEYLSVFNPELAAGARTAATNASNETQQQIQANAAREAAGMRLQGAREATAAESSAKSAEAAAKRLDQLSSMIMGQMDPKTGEFLPGALDEGEETATAVFKQSLLDAGIPAEELGTTQFRWDKDRRIMQVLDEAGNVVQEGSPTGLGKQAYQRYFGRV